MNYKELDTERILIYLESFECEVSVEDIIAYSDADKLRVYPILFELEQEGVIDVVKRDMFGTPTMVKFIARGKD